MTVGDWALFFGLLVNAAVVLYAVRLIYKTSKDIKAIHKETNSMRAALEQAEFAKGKLAGQLEADGKKPEV